MTRLNDTRRRVVGATGVLGVGLAGCLDALGSDESDEEPTETGDDDGDEAADGNETADDEQDDDVDIEDLRDPSLTIHLENGAGEPVSSGVVVTVEAEGEPLTYELSDSIEDGQVTQEDMDDGDYEITAESEDDAFDPVEESATIDGDDVEVTLVLEGADGDD